MRILIITSFFPPERNAGTENYTLGLAKILAANGNEVQVVCAGSWDKGPNYWNGVKVDSETGVPVHRIHLNWEKASDPNLVTYHSREVEEWMDLFLEENKPDIVHVTSTMTLGVGVLRSAKRMGIPLILTLMDFWFICPRTVLLMGDGRLCDGIKTLWDCQQCLLMSSRMYRRSRTIVPENFQPALWVKLSESRAISRRRGLRGLALRTGHRKDLMRQAMELPDVILSHSDFVKRSFADTDYSHRAVSLPNGHDLSWLKSYQGKSKSPHLRFGYMGQIIEIKGVSVLLKAFVNAGLDGHATLDVWGDLGIDEGYTRVLIDTVGKTESIKLRGRFDRDQLAMVLADIDILVVPSLWYENAPLVIYEAFAAKTPVIASNLGGMAEAVTHDVNGLLFDRNNVDELAFLLSRFLKEPALLGQLQEGIPLVKTMQEEYTELESIYRELTQQKITADHPEG